MTIFGFFFWDSASYLALYPGLCYFIFQNITFYMEDASPPLRYVQPWNWVPSELEADWLPKVTGAMRVESQKCVGMLTKLWVDMFSCWVRWTLSIHLPLAAIFYLRSHPQSFLPLKHPNLYNILIYVRILTSIPSADTGRWWILHTFSNTPKYLNLSFTGGKYIPH